MASFCIVNIFWGVFYLVKCSSCSNLAEYKCLLIATNEKSISRPGSSMFL